MHFVHLILLIFKFKGKGKFVLPIVVFSFLLVAGMYAGFYSLSSLGHDRIIDGLFSSISFFLAAAINSLVTKNYIIGSDGEREYFEEEGTYIYIRVSIWTKIFIGLGLIGFAGVIVNMIKPLIHY